MTTYNMIDKDVIEITTYDRVTADHMVGRIEKILEYNLVRGWVVSCKGDKVYIRRPHLSDIGNVIILLKAMNMKNGSDPIAKPEMV